MAKATKAAKTIKYSNNLTNKSLEIAASVFFVLITAVFPLYITRTHYLSITGDKAAFFTTITFITTIVIAGILFLCTEGFPIKEYFAKRPLTAAEWALLAFILFALLSTIFSPFQEVVWRGDPIGRWEGFWTLLCYVLTFFIIARFYKPDRIHFLIFATGSAIVSAYGILQFAGLDILVATGFFVDIPLRDTPQGSVMLPPLGRIFRTTLGNINVVAAYSALVSVLFAGLFAGEKSRWGLAYLAASALAFGLLLISRGDAGSLGVLGAMVLSIPYWVANHERLGKILIALASWSAVFAIYNSYLLSLKVAAETEPLYFAQDQWFIVNFTARNTILLAGITIALLVAGLGLLLLVRKWRQPHMKIIGIVLMIIIIVSGLVLVETEGARREGQPHDGIWQAHEVMHGRFEDHFGSGRGFIWIRSIPVLTENPFLGSGSGTFLQAMGVDFQEESIRRFGIVFDTAHNTYLQMAITLGIPALLAYLIFLISLYAYLLNKAFVNPILLAFGTAAVGYLIQSFFQIDTPIDRPLLWVVLGVIAGELCREEASAAIKTWS